MTAINSAATLSINAVVDRWRRIYRRMLTLYRWRYEWRLATDQRRRGGGLE